MQDCPFFGALNIPRYLSLELGNEHNAKFFRNQFFGLWKSTIHTIFHIWKNAYHRDPIKISVRMELYDKKFGSTRGSYVCHDLNTLNVKFHNNRTKFMLIWLKMV